MNYLEGPPSQFRGGVHIGARALHVPNLIWFGYIPVGRRGIISSFKRFLPAVATCRGRGGGVSILCLNRGKLFLSKVLKLDSVQPFIFRKRRPKKAFHFLDIRPELSFLDFFQDFLSVGTFFFRNFRTSKPFTSCTTHYGKSFLLSGTSHPYRSFICRDYVFHSSHYILQTLGHRETKPNEKSARK